MTRKKSPGRPSALTKKILTSVFDDGTPARYEGDKTPFERDHLGELPYWFDWNQLNRIIAEAHKR